MGVWSRRLRRITLREVAGLAEAQATLIVYQLAKWWAPRGRLLDWTAPSDPVARPDRSTIEIVGWSVTRAARYGLFRPKCLVRALAIRRMLQRRGIENAVVRVGVRRDSAAFEAHAWAEVGNIIVGDSAQHTATFTPVANARMVAL